MYDIAQYSAGIENGQLGGDVSNARTNKKQELRIEE